MLETIFEMYFNTYMILETPHLRSLQVFCLIKVTASTCTAFTWKCQTRNPLCTMPTYPRSLGEVREGRICENPWDPSRTNTSDVVRWHQCGWTKSFGRWPLYQHHRRSNEGSYQDISIYQPCLGLQTLWVAKANS